MDTVLGSAVVVWSWRSQVEGGSAARSLGPIVGMVVAVGPRVAHRASSPGGASPSPFTEQTPVPLASDSSWVSLTGVGCQLCL